MISTMPQVLMPVSPEFKDLVEDAIGYAQQSGDEAVAYAAAHVPIFMQIKPTHEQASAGGCRSCTYLGLWANAWPGYAPEEHGIIWVFEDGIRRIAERTGKDLFRQIYETVIHEIDHALQRDHVLEALQRQKAMAQVMDYDGNFGNARPCG